MAHEEGSAGCGSGQNDSREVEGVLNPELDEIGQPEFMVDEEMKMMDTLASSMSTSKDEEFSERIDGAGERGEESHNDREMEKRRFRSSGLSQFGGSSALPESNSFLVLLQEFSELEIPAGAGEEYEKLLKTMVGEAVIKGLANGVEEKVLTQKHSAPSSPKEAGSKSPKSTKSISKSISRTISRSLSKKERLTEDMAENFVNEKLDIERIQLEVRERILQGQERALEMAAQLQQDFLVWEKNVGKTRSVATSNGEPDKQVNGVDNDAALGPDGSRDDIETTRLCQFLVNYETGRLEGDTFPAEERVWGLSDMLLSNPLFNQQTKITEAESAPEVEGGSDFEMCSDRRFRLIQNVSRVSDEECLERCKIDSLRQKLMNVVNFGGRLAAREWRVGVDVDLVRAYYKILLEFVVNQTTVMTEYLNVMEDQNDMTQKDLHSTKSLLGKSRGEADSLRAENTVLSKFVDQLTEEIESCQGEILNCREALKAASQRSAQTKAEFHELHGRTDILRGELEGRLEKEVAEVEKLNRILEGKRWEGEAETSIYLEVVDDLAQQCLTLTKQLKAEHIKEGVLEERLEKEATEVRKLTDDLEETRWEHKAESSIYLGVVDDIATQLSQEMRRLRIKLSKEENLEGRLEKETTEVKRLTKELEGAKWEHRAESSICFEIFDEIEQKWLKEIRHLQAELSKEGALERELEKKYAEVKKLMEELERTILEHEAESIIYLEVVNERAQEWALKFDSLTTDFSLKEGVLDGLLEEKDIKIKKLTEELDLTIWEQEVESSIYLEVVSGRARDWAQTFDNLAADFSSKQVVRRKELQASCSFSGRTQRESLAYEDTSPLLSGGFENLKATLNRPSPLKGPSPLSDQSAVSSPGKSSDPIVVVVRRNTQAAVEGFMVDIGESPSKKANKEVVSSLRMELLELRREKEHLVEKHTSELNEQKGEYAKEVERIKLELEEHYQRELASLEEHLVEKNTSEGNEQNVEYAKEVERIKVELKEQYQQELANLEEHLLEKHKNELNELKGAYEKDAERRVELEEQYQGEVVRLKAELLSMKQQLEQAMQDKESSQSSYGNVDKGLPDFEVETKCGETLDIGRDIDCNEDDSESMLVETREATLVAERNEFHDRVRELELQISELQEKVTKLEGERSWLEERVPGLEKKLATEQSRLEDTVAGHAFERDQLKLIASSHKSEQTRLESAVAELKNERNYLATAIATLGLEWRNLRVTNQYERERWRSAYVMALKDIERALSRTQKQLKEERAQKGAAESDVQRLKTEILTMQQESKDVSRLLERNVAENIGRVVSTSQQMEFAICQKIQQQTLRFEAVQKQVEHLSQAFQWSQMSEMDSVNIAENLRRAEKEVDVLGDEVDSLVALLEKLYRVLDQYAPVLHHYPGVAEMAKLVEYELIQRSMQPEL